MRLPMARRHRVIDVNPGPRRNLKFEPPAPTPNLHQPARMAAMLSAGTVELQLHDFVHRVPLGRRHSHLDPRLELPNLCPAAPSGRCRALLRSVRPVIGAWRDPRQETRQKRRTTESEWIRLCSLRPYPDVGLY